MAVIFSTNNDMETQFLSVLGNVNICCIARLSEVQNISYLYVKNKVTTHENFATVRLIEVNCIIFLDIVISLVSFDIQQINNYF